CKGDLMLRACIVRNHARFAIAHQKPDSAIRLLREPQNALLRRQARRDRPVPADEAQSIAPEAEDGSMVERAR
ncbi:MAG TPA: hypothetical protein VHS56_02160, partial [Candidatus Cybelea sp.]|nr:hypothetical protein [Candidatus Cybelea sp.]